MTGRFIVFEGGEGCGKSTQAARLASHLDALLTRQPGGTAVGERLREVVLEGVAGDVVPRAEALLMAADRAQHVEQLLRPALDSGRHVVCDRYIPSSVAYQGAGRGLDESEIRRISEWAVDGLWPALIVLLVVDPNEARARIGGARDRIEAAGDDFHRRVDHAFRAMATDDPSRWAIIDGMGTEGDVWERVRRTVSDRLDLGVR